MKIIPILFLMHTIDSHASSFDPTLMIDSLSFKKNLIEDENIFLKTIVSCQGDDISCQTLETIYVKTNIKPGQMVHVSKNEVLQAIKEEGYNLSSDFKWLGSAVQGFQTDFESLSEQIVLDTLNEYTQNLSITDLPNHVKRDSLQFHIQSKSVKKKVWKKPYTIKLNDSFQSSVAKILTEFPLVAEIIYQDCRDQFEIRVKGEILAETTVTDHPIKKDSILMKSDLKTAFIRLQNKKDLEKIDLYLLKKDLIGMQMKHSRSGHRHLTSHDIQRPYLVKKNQSIRLFKTSHAQDGIEISLEGTSLDNGGLGEKIRIKVQDRILHGWVHDQKTARISA